MVVLFLAHVLPGAPAFRLALSSIVVGVLRTLAVDSVWCGRHSPSKPSRCRIAGWCQGEDGRFLILYTVCGEIGSEQTLDVFASTLKLNTSFGECTLRFSGVACGVRSIRTTCAASTSTHSNQLSMPQTVMQKVCLCASLRWRSEHQRQ